MNIVSIISFSFLLLFFSTNITAQEMGILHKYKKLKKDEAISYIRLHNGVMKPDPDVYFCIFYECDDNILIIENTIEKKFTLYYDRAKYYSEIAETKRLREDRPLAKQQEIIKDVEGNKTILLDYLFSEIGIVKPDKLNDVDLKIMNKKLRQYGYEKAYFNLILNLIVFCGEYVREQKGGHWTTIDDAQHLGEVKPMYVDRTGRKYDFWINTLLIKGYMEYSRFNIPDVISSALMPEIFKAVPNPNPTMGNPNEK